MAWGARPFDRLRVSGGVSLGITPIITLPHQGGRDKRGEDDGYAKVSVEGEGFWEGERMDSRLRGNGGRDFGSGVEAGLDYG